MRAWERKDVVGAWIVVSGPTVYNCYLGPDPQIPRCDCPDSIYTDNPECRHVKFCKEQS